MAGITRPRHSKPVTHQQPLRERRNRRTERRSAKPVVGKPAGRRAAVRSQVPPPVMARGTLQDMAVPQRKRAQPRHRYDFTLSMPGAEVRLPSMPVVRLSWRVASAALFLLMAASLYLLLSNPAFQVDVLEVDGLQRVTLEDINSAYDISGEPIIKVDPEEVRQALQAEFPEFSSIEVNVFLPAKVKLEVLERTPVIVWVQNGQEQWIDGEGIAFPPRGDAGELIRIDASGLPQSVPAEKASPAETVSGDTAAQQDLFLQPELVATIQSLGAYVPEGVMILFSPEHGFGWEDPNGWQVYFGKNLEDIDQKLRVFQALQENLLSQGIQPSLISVEYLHTPYYRTER
jgi:cell division protein FtsQ